MDNHANELQWATQYAVYLTPRIVIGHRFRLLDFQKADQQRLLRPQQLHS